MQSTGLNGMCYVTSVVFAIILWCDISTLTSLQLVVVIKVACQFHKMFCGISNFVKYTV